MSGYPAANVMRLALLEFLFLEARTALAIRVTKASGASSAIRPASEKRQFGPHNGNGRGG